MFVLSKDKKLHGKYEFVTLASLRAEQLQMGARPRVDEPDRKVTMVAQIEVATGEVERFVPESAEEITDDIEEE
jgi:DNA-directed RNA polymerase subunit K/omega